MLQVTHSSDSCLTQAKVWYLRSSLDLRPPEQDRACKFCRWGGQMWWLKLPWECPLRRRRRGTAFESAAGTSLGWSLGCVTEGSCWVIVILVAFAHLSDQTAAVAYHYPAGLLENGCRPRVRAAKGT